MITLSMAQRMIGEAVAKAEQLGTRVAVAVCDAEGNAVAIARMDGMGAFVAEVAWDQVVNYVAGLEDDNYGEEACHPNMIKGLKLIEIGEVVRGMISVFGAEPEQNDKIAEAALAAL